MKRLRDDDGGLIPLLVGVAIVGAALFGGTYLFTGEDPMTLLVDFMKAMFVASLFFVLGLLFLMGKLPVIPGPYALLAGLGCIGASLYIGWYGFGGGF